MSKYLIKINNIDELNYNVDGFILGYKAFSICFEKKFDIDEIKKIISMYPSKEIYVSLNKMIFNNELELYKKVLFELDNLNINGIIVGDCAALTYDLKTNIIIDQLHLNNSYLSIKHYEDDGVFGVYLTNDIKSDEINEIRLNTNIKLFKDVFVRPHLSTSKRLLISNYEDHFKIKKENNCFIKENKEQNYYKIIEEDKLTHILARPINLLSYINNIEVDYFVLSSYLLDKDNYSYVVDSFVNDKIENNDKINSIYESNLGFINKDTIYKVKDK